MTNWLDRANAAYQERLAREEAASNAKTQRLLNKVSEFLDEALDASAASLSGRISVNTGTHWITFVFGDEDEKTIAVLYECLFCGGEFPVVMNNMEDLGLFIYEGFPGHKLVCRNQQEA